METSSSTAAILLLQLPPQALGGIDLLSFTTTPQFKGIKNLPSGFHFVFTGSTSSLSVRHGAWINVKSTRPTPSAPADLFIKTWDSATESLRPETDVRNVLTWRANLGSVWREGLTPYRQSASDANPSTSTSLSTTNHTSQPEYESNDWRQLTDCITPALLTRILGPDPSFWTLTSASSARVDQDDIPGLTAFESRTPDERELMFLPIDLRKTWREGATGRERTEAVRDRSWYLASLVRTYCRHDPASTTSTTATTSASAETRGTGGDNGDEDEDEDEDENDYLQLLGELQLTFLQILTLNNYSSLEQWRRILSLLFTCRLAITTHTHFFTRFLATLHLQLSHCEDVDGGGLFDLSDEGATFLKPLLLRFKGTLEEVSGPGGLGAAATGTGADGANGANSARTKTAQATALQDLHDEYDDLTTYLHETHGWQFAQGQFTRSGLVTLEDGEEVDLEDATYDDEDEWGEYAPQIVELSLEQRRELGLGEGPLPVGLGKGKSLKEVVRDAHEDENESEEDEEEVMDLEDMDARF